MYFVVSDYMLSVYMVIVQILCSLLELISDFCDINCSSELQFSVVCRS